MLTAQNFADQTVSIAMKPENSDVRRGHVGAQVKTTTDSTYDRGHVGEQVTASVSQEK